MGVSTSDELLVCVMKMFSIVKDMFDQATFNTTRRFNGRLYNIMELNEDVKKHMLEKICNEFNSYKFICICRSSSIKILNSNLGLWYRIGLVMSDGALTKTPGYIVFSTSNSHTTYCILKAFNEVNIYFRYYMVNVSSSNVIPIFNMVVKDYEVWNKVSRIKSLKSIKLQEHYLIDFLAGIIDGDGSIDKDNVRISISPKDALYSILLKIFKDNCKYDHSKYMLRISIRFLRSTNMLQKLYNKILNPKKKLALKKLMQKRHRLDINYIKYDDKLLLNILKSMTLDELKLLLKSRIISKAKRCRNRLKIYRYIVWYTSDKNLKLRIISTLSKIFKSIEPKLLSDIKVRDREVIIYSQQIVHLLIRAKLIAEDLVKENLGAV